MKVSKFFIPTRKEIPKEAEIPSHRMMLRAGLIRQHAAGVYSILPMGWKVLRNIMKVIHEEMDAIGCQEFFLPALSPGELWTKSGRWETFGDVHQAMSVAFAIAAVLDNVVITYFVAGLFDPFCKYPDKRLKEHSRGSNPAQQVPETILPGQVSQFMNDNFLIGYFFIPFRNKNHRPEKAD